MHTCIYITSALQFFSSFHTSSILLGRLADPDPSRQIQYHPLNLYPSNFKPLKLFNKFQHPRKYTVVYRLGHPPTHHSNHSCSTFFGIFSRSIWRCQSLAGFFWLIPPSLHVRKVCCPKVSVSDLLPAVCIMPPPGSTIGPLEITHH